MSVHVYRGLISNATILKRKTYTTVNDLKYLKNKKRQKQNNHSPGGMNTPKMKIADEKRKSYLVGVRIGTRKVAYVHARAPSSFLITAEHCAALMWIFDLQKT